MDLDNLKAVNDRFGHDSGDELLRATAGALERGRRSEDLLCRYGGDEFVIVAIAQQDLGPMLIGRIREAVTELNETRLPERQIHVSLGSASCSTITEENLAQLLARADHDMYAAKRRSRSTNGPL